jgi:hypothetical protein
MANQLRVAELDFDLIKENLKDFLRTKPEFTDYDFEGSAMSVLIDLLSYNTHYNAVIGNMLIQEMFLDTAVKKQSLALISKRLGYLPKSYRAPKAIITLEVFPFDAPSTITIPKNTKFSAKVTSTETAYFSTRDAVTINRSLDGRYIFSNLEIYEGDSTIFRYVVGDPLSQKFEIPSRLVDTTLIRVYIQESISSTGMDEWKNFNTLIDINSQTKAFFVKLNENLNYEVYFGDDVLGKNVLAGNVVHIDYVSTNGPIGNDIRTFGLIDSIQGYTNHVITTVTPSYGGAYPESNDSIRRNAQNTVLIQNRAVTESDYEAIISQILPVDTVAVYGGETMTPPVYGKVFISAKLIGTTTPLLDSQKYQVIQEVKKRSVLALVHEFIDPSYTYLVIDTKVKVDTRKTSMSMDGLQTKITDAVILYGNENLNKFNSSFEYSDLVSYIDEIDRAIVSNDTNIKLRKEAEFVYNADSIYEFDFDTEIKASNSREQNITSNAFRTVDYPDTDIFIDDLDGKIRLYRTEFNQKFVVEENVGTVDYTTGHIIMHMKASVAVSNSLNIQVIPANRNILPSRNNIITLADTDILVQINAT